MKKRCLTLLLALVLAVSLALPAAAADPREAQSSAEQLFNLGLFLGVGVNPDGSPDFDLDRAPTRAESITILVRLLGGEKEAKSRTWKTPFNDVPDWAKPYVGYAYNKGYAKGVWTNQFGSDRTVTAEQHLTFLLRAMGYKDGADFVWSAPWPLTDSLQITLGDYPQPGGTFNRGDAAVVSARALFAPRKGTQTTLLEHLLNTGAITNKNVVVWDYSLMDFRQDFAAFLFYPVKGSPGTFKHFKFNAVTVNGLPCDTLQVNTPEEVNKYLASIGEKAGGFGYVAVDFDGEAARAAATQFYTDANGTRHPMLGFAITYTGTQLDGTQVTGTLTQYYY